MKISHSVDIVNVINRYVGWKTQLIKAHTNTIVLKVRNIYFGGVIVGVLASSAMDRGFEPRSGQTKDYKIGTCCFSAKHAPFNKEKEQRMVGSESE